MLRFLNNKIVFILEKLYGEKSLRGFSFCFGSNLLYINKINEILAGELSKIINVKLGNVNLTETGKK
jgi:hypothetical protein